MTKFKKLLYTDENVYFGMTDFLKSENKYKFLPLNFYVILGYKKIRIQNNYDINEINLKDTFSIDVNTLHVHGNSKNIRNEDIEYFVNMINKNKNLLMKYIKGYIDSQDLWENIVFI